MSAEPQPPLMNQPRAPTELRMIIIRNKEIIGELLRIAEFSNMTIVPMSASGLISYAEMTPRGSLEPVTVINGLQQIEAIFGAIYPPYLNLERKNLVIVTLSGITNGSCRGIRLVSHGDVEVKYQMRRVQLQALAPQVPAPREHRMITITTNQDIIESLASLSQQTGQIIYLRNGKGTISDGTVYSYTREELLTNLGRADILQLFGDVFPNGTGKIKVTLSGVSGGTARAYRLITDGDVVLDASFILNH